MPTRLLLGLVLAYARGMEPPEPPVSCTLPLSTRAGCYGQRWAAPPDRIGSSTTPSGPLAGNGDMGLAVAGSSGSLALYTGKSDFWGIRDVPVGGCAYTIMSGAWVSLSPAGATGWAGAQDLLNARVNASTGPLHSSTIVAAESNVAITTLRADRDVNVTLTVSMDLSKYDALPSRVWRDGPALLAAGQNTHRRLTYASLLPCTSAAVIWPAVRSVRLDRGRLLVTNQSSTGCLLLLGRSVVHQPDSAECNQTAWAARADGQIASALNQSLCLSHGDGSPTQFGSRAVGVAPCGAGARQWVLHGDRVEAANRSLFGQQDTAQCLSAAPPNFNNSLAQAVLVNSENGLLQPTSVQAGPGSQSVEVLMKAGRVYTMVISSVSQRDSGIRNPADAALELARAAILDTAALSAEHAVWWANYWAQGAAVSLGSKRLLLEGWWYGSQYLFGSATRPGKVAPGLWGPWVSGGEASGWNGDYTIDYNFQANFWGAVSSNRAGFMAPYFDSVMSLLPLGRLRAQSSSWHDSRGAFGPAGQQVQGMNCGPSPTGWAGPLGQCPEGLGNYSGINLPGHFGPFPGMTFPTDMGIRSIAGFAWTPFMQYYDSTLDEEFLRTKAYPYLRGIVDFYSSYLREGDDHRLHVPYSCGDEICSYENSEGIDPMEDLAFARMAFDKAVEYSVALQVDAGLRPQWRDASSRLANYPLTTVPAPFACKAWNCSCPGMSSYFGTDAGVSWGCAPPAAQAWWKQQPCATAGPCSGPASSCHAPGCRQRVDNVTVFAQSRYMKSGAPLPGLPYSGYPIVYDAAIHPAEVITRHSHPSLRSTAWNTVWLEGLSTEFNPVNGFVLSWIPAARIVDRHNAKQLLDYFTAAVASSSAKSWYHMHVGGGYEDVGAVDAINSMLLVTQDGTLALFPGWPVGEEAQFDQLRAHGAFLVSASIDAAATVSGITVFSEAGVPLQLATPWPGVAPVVRVSGSTRVVPVLPGSHDGWYKCNTSKGVTYTISSI